MNELLRYGNALCALVGMFFGVAATVRHSYAEAATWFAFSACCRLPILRERVPHD